MEICVLSVIGEDNFFLISVLSVCRLVKLPAAGTPPATRVTRPRRTARVASVEGSADMAHAEAHEDGSRCDQRDSVKHEPPT